MEVIIKMYQKYRDRLVICDHICQVEGHICSFVTWSRPESTAFATFLYLENFGEVGKCITRENVCDHAILN